MITPSRACGGLLLGLVAFVSLPGQQPDSPQPDSPQQSTEQDQRARQEMRALTDVLTMTRVSPQPRRVERVADPVFRFHSRTRDYSIGTLWAWGTSGRPAAIFKLFEYNGTWWHQFSATSADPVVVERFGETIWQPQSSRFAIKQLPDAPPPSDKAALRFRQMKTLARRFAAHQFWRTSTENNVRFDLRALPQPIHRYADEQAGIVEGAAFLFAHEIEPELILLIEAVKSGNAPSWQYGVAPLGSAEFHVELDGEQVFSRDRAIPPADRNPNALYCVYGVKVNGDPK